MGRSLLPLLLFVVVVVGHFIWWCGRDVRFAPSTHIPCPRAATTTTTIIQPARRHAIARIRYLRIDANLSVSHRPRASLVLQMSCWILSSPSRLSTFNCQVCCHPPQPRPRPPPLPHSDIVSTPFFNCM